VINDKSIQDMNTKFGNMENGQSYFLQRKKQIEMIILLFLGEGLSILTMQTLNTIKLSYHVMISVNIAQSFSFLKFLNSKPF
jgi:hypothetical protein